MLFGLGHVIAPGFFLINLSTANLSGELLLAPVRYFGRVEANRLVPASRDCARFIPIECINEIDRKQSQQDQSVDNDKSGNFLERG